MSTARSATTTTVRVYVFAAIGSLLGFTVAVALFLGGLFSHHTGFFTAAEAALVVSMLCSATTATWRAYMFYRSIGRIGLNGRSTSREKPPRRFAIWLTLNGMFAALWWIAAAFLIWSLSFPNSNGR